MVPIRYRLLPQETGCVGARMRALEQSDELVGRERTADEKTLHDVAAVFDQEGHLFARLDAFCDQLHAQAVPERNDRFDDRRRMLAAVEISDERAVDLETGHGKTF